MENLDLPGVMENPERRYEMAGLGDGKINPRGNNEYIILMYIDHFI